MERNVLMRYAAWIGGAALVLAASASCLRQTSFRCDIDEDCGAAGTCELVGYCSFADDRCPDGRRYGDLSGDRAGTCVGTDEPVDAGVDVAGTCYGTGLVRICPDAEPTLPVTLSGTIDTTASPMCVAHTSPTGTMACVIAGTTITADAAVRVVGTLPLVLVATTTITISAGGTLQADSVRMPVAIGAGGNSTACASGTAPAGGGGHGGSFGGRGGDGGQGGLGAGGIAPAATDPTQLRGGCPGANGSGALGGVGGAGGGALFLIAGTSITIDGAVTASGAGGNGAVGSPGGNGGAGGGSGGLIGLDSPLIGGANTGTIVANGGGGGEGSGNTATGLPGGESLMPSVGGAGGAGGANSGGNGGAGAGGATRDGVAGVDGTNGGGGGGGGAGVVKLLGTTSTFAGTVSPPPT